MPIFSNRMDMNWADLFDKKGVHAGKDIVREALYGHGALWECLVEIAGEEWKSFTSSQLKVILPVCKAMLDERLGLDEGSQAYFDGDYALFTEFVGIQRGFKETPDIDLNAIWPVGMDKEARYEALIIRMMNGRFELLLQELKELKKRNKSLTKDRVSGWAREFERFTCLKHYPVAPIEKDAGVIVVKKTSPDIIATIKGWLVRFLQLFLNRIKKPNTLESLAILNQLWSLTKRHDFLPHLLGVNLTSTPFEHFHQADDVDIRKRLRINSKAFNPAAWFSEPVKQLLKTCDKDMERLTIWLEALFHSALIHYLENPDDLSSFLEAFKRMQEEMRAYGIELYGCRMKAEEAWRKDGKTYLRKLDELDIALSAIEKRLITLQRACLADVKGVLNDDDFQNACDGFEVLLSDEMLALEAAHFVEHSCYCQSNTEGHMAHEMEARNDEYEKKERPFYSYCVAHTFTQTDYVVTQHLAEQSARLRKKMIQLHPDRLSDKLKAIAEYCTQEVSTQRERCDKVSNAWYMGSWYAKAPGLKEQLTDEQLEFYGDLEPVFIEKPAQPLGLGMVSLHRDYLEWVSNQANLRKKPRGFLSPQHRLYSDREVSWAIEEAYAFRKAFFVLQADFRKTAREQVIEYKTNLAIAHIRAESKAKIAAYKAETVTYKVQRMETLMRMAERSPSAEARANVETAKKEAEDAEKDLELARQAQNKAKQAIENVYEEVAAYIEESSAVEKIRKFKIILFLKEPEFQYVRHHRTPPLAERKNIAVDAIIFQPLAVVEAQAMHPSSLFSQEKQEEEEKEELALVLVKEKEGSNVRIESSEKEWMHSNARIAATIDEARAEEAKAKLQCLIARMEAADPKAEKVAQQLDSTIQLVLKKKLKKYLNTHSDNFDKQELKDICVKVAKDLEKSIGYIYAQLESLIQREPEFEMLRMLSKSILRESVGENPHRFFFSESTRANQGQEATPHSTI